jgi:hypothetical protein
LTKARFGCIVLWHSGLFLFFVGFILCGRFINYPLNVPLD